MIDDVLGLLVAFAVMLALGWAILWLTFIIH